MIKAFHHKTDPKKWRYIKGIDGKFYPDISIIDFGEVEYSNILIHLWLKEEWLLNKEEYEPEYG